MNSRRLICAAKDRPHYSVYLVLGLVPRKFGLNNGSADVRFGSKADICAAKSDVRFAPNSDWESEFSAKGHVRITPESGRVRRKPWTSQLLLLPR